MISLYRAMMILPVLCITVQAQDALDKLSEIEPGDSAAYIAQRATFGPSDLPALRTASANDQWTKENWVRALAAEAVRLRIENPDLASNLDRPRGLDPETYRNFRKPEPLCLRQFNHEGLPGIPLLLERWRWTLGEHPFSEGAAGEKERSVFRQAILAAAGQTADIRARFFLEGILRDAREDERWRSEAAISLGMCTGDAALPALLDILDGTGPLMVRQACTRALGRIPSRRALNAIQSRLGKPDLDRSLVTALGLLGSKWGWKARGDNSGNEIRKDCAGLLVQQISRVPTLADEIGRALALVSWPDSLEQVEAMTESPATRSILPVLRRALDR